LGPARVKRLDLQLIGVKPVADMQRLTIDQPIPEALRGAVLALGNFDGFHLGHQAVVGRAVQRGAHERRPVIVATFDPHPVRHFRPDTPPFRLTSLDQRQELFRHAGADAMLVFRFDSALASTSAEDFVSQLLAGRIGAAGVVTGEDFTFGKGRGGNAVTLRASCAAHDMIAETVAPILQDGEPVSSSRVRDALVAGDPGTATRLLTRPFAVEATVIHGDARGRDLGWPTANLELGPYQRPAYGIYAVRVRLDDGSEHDGVASLGIRPMFDPPRELLEANLFDFDGDLYGRTIEIALHHYLRPEARFGSLDALKAQIEQDAAEARALLAGGAPLA
jgi:riboflavin kinase/FMN adenylyltransferase